MKPLPIHEIFDTIQGEGAHTGRHAFFIRTYGCPLRCSFCDSAGTWHRDYAPPHISMLMPGELVAAARAAGAPVCVITGGEPAIHDLTDLTTQLQSAGIRVHIETSGSYPLKGAFDWVTVSPKMVKPTLPENLLIANEVKIVVEDEESLEFWIDYLKLAYNGFALPIVWLHPEWSKARDKRVLGAILRTVKANGDRYRAGIQMHKYFQADTFDSRSMPNVPLGGVTPNPQP